MDGIRLADALAEATGYTLPIVLLSSIGGVDPAIARGRLAATLSKPVKPVTLRNALATAVAGEAPSPAAAETPPQLPVADAAAADPRRGGQPRQPAGRDRDAGAVRPSRRRRRRRRRGGRGRPPPGVRPRADGRADAEPRRARGDAADPHGAGARAPAADRRDDRQRLHRGPRRLHRRRDGRLPDEAGRRATTWRGSSPARRPSGRAASASWPTSPSPTCRSSTPAGSRPRPPATRGSPSC